MADIKLGLGIGWRAELAVAIDRDPAYQFVEITAEHFDREKLPAALYRLKQQNRVIVPHGISVSLGSADGMHLDGLRHLDRLAREFDSPFVSEHLAFVRAGNLEAGHLLPVPRTKGALKIVVENIQRARKLLSVPLAIENISALFAWPNADFSEGEFLTRVLEETDSLLLLDTSNVYASAHNLKLDVREFLDAVPLDRLAYVHVGGGFEAMDGTYHDSHAHAVTDAALHVLEELCARVEPPGVMLERDDHFPAEADLKLEIQRINAAIQRGRVRRG